MAQKKKCHVRIERKVIYEVEKEMTKEEWEETKENLEQCDHADDALSLFGDTSDREPDDFDDDCSDFGSEWDEDE